MTDALTILITGATDGIGLEATRKLVANGHHVLIAGRNPSKLERTRSEMAAIPGGFPVEVYQADFSDISQVDRLADEIDAQHSTLDVIINNAGVFRTSTPRTPDGFDVRFVVNTFAPYWLTRRLLHLVPPSGRILNLSSAAQAPVNLAAMAGRDELSHMEAYSQSKLALTMWSSHLASELGDNGPTIVAVNPGSLLASKMVKEGFGVAGRSLSIGADVLCNLATTEDLEGRSGGCFDNDIGQFGPPHPDADTPARCAEVVTAIGELTHGHLASDSPARPL